MDKTSELIKRRRNQLWVHSVIYYKMDDNLIEDETFDKWSQELVQLQSDYPEISRRTEMYKVFKDWDGSTGAFLPLDDPIVQQRALRLLSYHKEIAGEVKTTNAQGKHNKVPQQQTRDGSSKTTTRKKATKQRGNALF